MQTRIITLLLLFLVTGVATAQKKIPAPAEVLGFVPGEDRKLASWDQIVDYFQKLDAASDRVVFETLGNTTMGKPFVMATISSPANLARLEEFRKIQDQLADPPLGERAQRQRRSGVQQPGQRPGPQLRHHHPQGAVQLAVAAAVEPVADGLARGRRERGGVGELGQLGVAGDITRPQSRRIQVPPWPDGCSPATQNRRLSRTDTSVLQ